MGTEVHFRSYFPGHYKMRDLNVESDNSWPPFCISKTLNGSLYNGCFPCPSTGYSEYDKEMLRRTMLEHEAVFRKQVYELHRLYGIQKDLMEELQKNGLSGISEHKAPSITISRSSQVQSDYATSMRQMSRLRAMNNCQKGEKPRYNDVIYPVNFPESNLQSSSGIIETETLQRLPSGAYIDYTKKPVEIPGSSSINTGTCSRICSGDSDIQFNLNLVSVSGSSLKEDCKFNYLYKPSPFTGLSDLNEPNIQTSLEGAPNSFPVMVFGPKSRVEENHGLNLPFSSTTLNRQIAFTDDGERGERAFSNVFQGAKEERIREAVCYNEAGKLFPKSFMNSTPHKERDAMLCEPVKLTSVLSTSSFKLENSIASSSKVPTWMKLPSDEIHASSPFSASFDGSSIVKMICSSDIATEVPNGALGSCQVGFDLKSPLRFEEKYSSSHLNGLNDGLQLQSHSTLHENFPFTGINLNAEAEKSFSGTQDGPASLQNKATNDIDGKCEGFLAGLSWLEGRPSSESLEPSSRVPSQVDLGFRKMSQEDVISNLEACSSSLHKRESRTQNNQPSHSLNSTKLIAPPNFDKLQQNLSSSSNEEKVVIDELKQTHSSEKSTSLGEKNGRNARNCLDLNSVFSFEDDPDSSQASAKVQTDAAAFSSRDGFQEELCLSEVIVIKEAAENIVKLSLDGFKLKDEVQTPPANALYMLAEMIFSSNNIINLNAASECRSQHLDDGLDLFELMTLQLEEMKPDSLCWRPLEAENALSNERSKASLLLARPRKAQGKKRRRRKDFQKDILPALASLSRQESMEDLQAIGELMKASGTPWQAGIRRRNIRGNGARARAISVTKVQINPPTPLFMVDGNNYNPEFEVNGHDMMGWGRRTRRCRSQRCPSVSISSTLI